jgi:hypothetical protein
MKKLLVLVLAVSLVSITLLGQIAAVQAVSTEYFGEDLGLGDYTRLPSWNNSAAAEAAFLSRLINVGTEDFEGFSHLDSAPLTIDFGIAGNATIHGDGYVYVLPVAVPAAVGRYPTSGLNFWETEDAFYIDFSEPIAAFGFYGIDIGDFSGQVVLELVNGGNRTFTVNNTIDGPSGSVLYYGIIEEDPALQFTRVTFSNTAEGVDHFGFDDFTIGSLEQVIQDHIEVSVDIKPGSDSNPLNVNSKGVLPVAILGTEDFDVMTVDPVSVVLTWRGISLPPPVGGVPPDDGVPPLRWAWEDVNSDGLMDLGLKYSMKAAGPLTITREASGPLDIIFKGELLDGTPIVGYDTVRVINNLMD